MDVNTLLGLIFGGGQPASFDQRFFFEPKDQSRVQNTPWPPQVAEAPRNIGAPILPSYFTKGG